MLFSFQARWCFIAVSFGAPKPATHRGFRSHITMKLGRNHPRANSVRPKAIVERPWRNDGNRTKRPEIQQILITRDQAIGLAGNGSTENRQVVGVRKQ